MYKTLFFEAAHLQCRASLCNIVVKRNAGHSKWANIKHTKGANDQQKSLLFAKLSRQMKLAIRGELFCVTIQLDSPVVIRIVHYIQWQYYCACICCIFNFCFSIQVLGWVWVFYPKSNINKSIAIVCEIILLYDVSTRIHTINTNHKRSTGNITLILNYKWL